jgi:hypothetical protein
MRQQSEPRQVTLRVDAITTARVPVETVLHLTDASLPGRPVVLGEAVFWIEGEAEAYALEQSALYPAPQRFAVYGPARQWIASYQCGQPLSPFTILEA